MMQIIWTFTLWIALWSVTIHPARTSTDVHSITPMTPLGTSIKKNPCGSSYHLLLEATGNCVLYTRNVRQSSWLFMRETDCIDGDYLVIDSAAKNKLILEHFKAKLFGSTRKIWIGLSAVDGTDWQWVNKQQPTYLNWMDVSASAVTLTDGPVCAYFNMTDGKWGKDFCANPKIDATFCEKSACTINNGGCSHQCNLPSLNCTCFPGYRMDVVSKECYGIDMCMHSNPGCQESCHSVNGTRAECRCDKHKGYVVAKDGVSCEPRDMCEDNDGGCQHHCVSINGTDKKCVCPEDIELDEDGLNCLPVSNPQLMWMALAMYLALAYVLLMMALRWRENRKQEEFRLTMRTTAKLGLLTHAQAIEDANKVLQDMEVEKEAEVKKDVQQQNGNEGEEHVDDNNMTNDEQQQKTDETENAKLGKEETPVDPNKKTPNKVKMKIDEDMTSKS